MASAIDEYQQNTNGGANPVKQISRSFNMKKFGSISLSLRKHRRKSGISISSPLPVIDDHVFDFISSPSSYYEESNAPLPSSNGSTPASLDFCVGIPTPTSPPKMSDIPEFCQTPSQPQFNEEQTLKKLQNPPLPFDEDSRYHEMVTCPVEEDEESQAIESVRYHNVKGGPKIEYRNEYICGLNQQIPEICNAGDHIAGFVAHSGAKDLRLDPIQQMQQDFEALEGGDAVFTTAMNYVLSKLIRSLGDRSSAYLFRDFAGNFSSFLDRFGPGGFDSHRAPQGILWIMKMVLPWAYAEDTACDTWIANYEETHGWICNIVILIGHRYASAILQDGTWESCVEQMGSTNSYVGNIAYRTSKTIVTTLPFNYDLVCKVLLMRIVTFGYESTEMSRYRYHHARLLSLIVERMDDTKNWENAKEYSFFLAEIIGELERSIELETDVLIKERFEGCLEYATSVFESVDRYKSAIATASPSSLIHEATVGSTKIRNTHPLSMNFGKFAIKDQETTNGMNNGYTCTGFIGKSSNENKFLIKSPESPAKASSTVRRLIRRIHRAFTGRHRVCKSKDLNCIKNMAGNQSNSAYGYTSVGRRLGNIFSVPRPFKDNDEKTVDVEEDLSMLFRETYRSSESHPIQISF